MKTINLTSIFATIVLFSLILSLIFVYKSFEINMGTTSSVKNNEVCEDAQVSNQFIGYHLETRCRPYDVKAMDNKTAQEVKDG